MSTTDLKFVYSKGYVLKTFHLKNGCTVHYVAETFALVDLVVNRILAFTFNKKHALMFVT